MFLQSAITGNAFLSCPKTKHAVYFLKEVNHNLAMKVALVFQFVIIVSLRSNRPTNVNHSV